MRKNPIVRTVADFLVPAILLFALYVQMHGDFGPGGGFQAGVIFAAGLILYSLVHGLERVQRVVSLALAQHMISVGVLLYAGVGVYTMIQGGQFLDYDYLSSDPRQGQHLGIFLVELGVGITVASVMITIFYCFAGRRRS